MSKGTFRDPVIQKVLEKYKFVFPVPEKIQKKGLALRKKTLIIIFKQSDKKSVFTSAIVSCYYWFKNHGFNFSLKKSAHFFYAGASACAIVIAIMTGLAINTKFFYTPQLPFGQVTFVKGNVFIQQKGHAMTALSTKDIIHPDDGLQTSQNSSVTIQLASKDVITLLPESMITINNSALQRKGTIITLAYGSVFSNINQQKDKLYQVKTPFCSVTVSGTQFMTSHTNNESRVELLKGKVEIRSVKDPDKLVPLIEKNAVSVNSNYKVDTYSLSAIDILHLQKLTLYKYIHNLKHLDDREINQILDKTKNEEKNIDSNIKQKIDEWNNLAPLDKLRRLGKPITMLHLSNNTKIAGHVASHTDSTIIIDTGAGILKIPRSRIVRKIPIK